MKMCNFHILNSILLLAALPHIAICQSTQPQPAFDLRSVGAYPRRGISNPDPPEVHAAIRRLTMEFNRLQMEARDKIRKGDMAGAERSLKAASNAAPMLGGRKFGQELIALLMGDIRRLQGRYQEALQFYLPTLNNGWRSGLDLDIALCYVRTGNYAGARRFYSDSMLLQDRAVTPADLPGTSTPRSLEASVLMAHGIEASLASREEEAVADLDAAGKLAPTNGVIPYWAGMALVYLNRGAEAGPYFSRAARYGHGFIAHEAKRHVEGIDGWLKQEAERKKQASIAIKSPSR